MSVVKNQQKELHTTIDLKHTEMLKKFEKVDEDIIPSLQSEKSALKSKIHELRENQVEEYMEICDKIKQIQQKIRSLKQEKKNYFLENSKYIFHYFEQKQQISASGELIKPTSTKINNFFKIKTRY